MDGSPLFVAGLPGRFSDPGHSQVATLACLLGLKPGEYGVWPQVPWSMIVI